MVEIIKGFKVGAGVYCKVPVLGIAAFAIVTTVHLLMCRYASKAPTCSKDT